MKRKKPRDMLIKVEDAPTRYQPDPHRRARVIPNKHKQYDRKAQTVKGSEPSDFPV